MYSLVIGILALFALGILVLSMKMSDMTQGKYTQDSSEYREAVAGRIRPVGQVYLPGEELEAPAPTVEAAADPEPVATVMSGPQVYNAACNVCHGTGAGEAPIVGNREAWAPRIAQGMDVLKDHAVNGFSGEAMTPMLPKGGRVDLSDQEVYDAVEYMVGESSQVRPVELEGQALTPMISSGFAVLPGS
jgi:cytochrome c5